MATDDDQLVQTISKMTRAVHTFKRYKILVGPEGRPVPKQPRKSWEDACRAAKEVVVSLAKQTFPVAEWQTPTMKVIEDFLASSGEVPITKAVALEGLSQTGKQVDEELFLVACVVNLCRAGQAADASAVKSNPNVFDNAMKDLLASGDEGKADELEPDESEELLSRMKTYAKDLLQGTAFCRSSLEVDENLEGTQRCVEQDIPDEQVQATTVDAEVAQEPDEKSKEPAPTADKDCEDRLHGAALEEENESLRDRCAALEERSARLLDEIGILRTRTDVDIPHWAGEIRSHSQRLEEATISLAQTPLGEKLRAILAGFRNAEAGLRGMNAAPLREEMSELKKNLAEQILLSQERESSLREENEALRQENERLRQPLNGAGDSQKAETKEDSRLPTSSPAPVTELNDKS